MSESFNGATGPKTMTSKIRYDDRGRFVGVDGSLEYLWVPGVDRCSYAGGLIASCHYANGGLETYERDSRGRLIRVREADTWVIEWGPDGVTAVMKKGQIARWVYAYDTRHRLNEVRYEGGLGEASSVTTYTYGPDGRLTSPRAFRYDVDGRVTDDERGTHYEWDNQGRLVRARAKNVETTWAYDCSR